MSYKEIDGDLISLAKEGTFDVIAHGCNCFCAMGAGIAPQMATAFRCNYFHYERMEFKGDINKLGSIEYGKILIMPNGKTTYGWDSEAPPAGGKLFYVVNAYTQYRYGSNHADGDKKPFDIDALTLCLRKMNHIFKGKVIGLPRIGAGLAGGNWEEIKVVIQRELKDCEIIIVNYKK
jgi:O-acetyl-ADP-ribose deacetylase (regulator of RNase III)